MTDRLVPTRFKRFGAVALMVLGCGGRMSDGARPAGTRGSGGMLSAELVGGTSPSGGSSTGGSRQTGGLTSLGGTGETGGSSGVGGAAGSGARPPLAVFTNGEWVDFRIAIEPDTPGVEIHLAPLGAGAAFVAERYLLFARSSDVAPRLALVIGPVSTVTQDACYQVEVSADGRELRIRMLRTYAFLDLPFRAALGRDGEGAVEPIMTEELPAFAGAPIHCDPPVITDLPGGPYQQLLGMVGLSSSTRACALGTDGEAGCWSFRQTGESPPPGPFESIGLVALGSACGLRPSGAVACWRLEEPSFSLPEIPAGTYRALAEYGSCGILESGAVRCWDPTAPGTAAFELAGDHRSVSGSETLGCTVTGVGSLVCWGYESSEIDRVPIELFRGEYARVATGQGVVCAMTNFREIDCAVAYSPRLVRLGRGPYVWLGGPWAICASDFAMRTTCIGRAIDIPDVPFYQVAAAEWSYPPCGLRLDEVVSCWGAGVDELVRTE